ncbi:hypothetical protein C0989_007833 [Termitomyces sp. Mn162]|nr:hypothetical protein C0989_007833 [Termitomyces sp. Mn162]KAH0586118.1 hypothetical protein H2248_007386 [Termitomyces sp. 'cryptogamus']
MAERYLLERLRFYFALLGGLYAALVVLLTVPFFQSHALYLNAVRLPFFAQFHMPEKYGLAPNKTLNLHIKTPDNETLGAWFVLSDQYYQSLSQIPANPDTHVPLAIKRHPTVLFFHGNAATRAFRTRVLHYEAYSSRLGTNVLAIDYRGFADSTGTPSEQGLVTDARAAWDWLLQQGAREDNILIVGHSLGTGVTSQLAAQLFDEGLKPRGIVLLSPFSSIQEVIQTYQFFGVIPLLKPLAIFPYIPDLITRAVVHNFDSLEVVPRIKGPVLIAHAEDDWDIPYTHSHVLFDAFMKPLLPLVDIPDSLTLTQESWETFSAERKVWITKRAEILRTTELQNFGTVTEFEEEGRKVVFLKTLAGGHDYLGIQEGVQDLIRTVFNVHRPY